MIILLHFKFNIFSHLTIFDSLCSKEEKKSKLKESPKANHRLALGFDFNYISRSSVVSLYNYIVYTQYIYICIHEIILLDDLSVVPIVTIVSNPAGTPVSGSTNTFDYPILSSVTLTCMVDPTPPAGATFQWDTGGCFTNDRHNVPACFPTGQTTQSVTDNDVTAEDSGTITCTVTIGDIDYTSGPLTLRISGTVYTQNIYYSAYSIMYVCM